jgi:hypothetical protein
MKEDIVKKKPFHESIIKFIKEHLTASNFTQTVVLLKTTVIPNGSHEMIRTTVISKSRTLHLSADLVRPITMDLAVRQDDAVHGYRPFHETIIETILGMKPSDVEHWADLIKTTAIPQNHSQIASTWKQVFSSNDFTEIVDNTGILDDLEAKIKTEVIK